MDQNHTPRKDRGNTLYPKKQISINYLIARTDNLLTALSYKIGFSLKNFDKIGYP